MSRQSRIVGALNELQRLGAVEAHHKETNPSEPNRLQWFVKVPPLALHYLSTTEVEAFIAGAEAMAQVHQRAVPVV